MRTTAWGCATALVMMIAGCGNVVVGASATSTGSTGGSTSTGTTTTPTGTTPTTTTSQTATSTFACDPNSEDISGWFVAGATPQKYQMGPDPTVSCDGDASLSLSSTIASAPGDFGTLMQERPATPWLGKRLRLRGSLKTENVTGWAGLWMRVDGKNQVVSAFDNMMNRAVVGTTDWTSYDVVLDVSALAVDVAYGILLSNEGTVWLDGVSLDIVPLSVPTTG